MKVLAVIPARYASTRLPAKPLADIGGKPMVQHVYERVRQAQLVNDVLVATDDARIMAAVENFGGTAVLTSPDCASGTDRLVELVRSHQADIYLNIQGDEPLLRPQDVDALVAALRDTPDVAAATLCYPISAEQAQNPALVKVVRDYAGRALYFSRAAIPFVRDADTASVQYWGHAGLYAYRPHALRAFGRHPQGPLEAAEKLEQLIKKAVRYYDSPDAVRFLRVRQTLSEIFTVMTEYSVTTARTAQRKSYEKENKYCRRACSYIAENLSKRISVEDVAHHAGISYGYLSGLFVQTLGMTLVEYINNARIRKAAQLISVYDMRLEELCKAVGISDTKYLSTLFRQTMGMTIREYKKLHK